MTGTELRDFRKKQGFTQEKLGEFLKISKDTIGDWEKSEVLTDKAERIIEDYLKEKNSTISIKGNTANGNQNSLNELRDEKQTRQELEIKELKTENKQIRQKHEAMAKALINSKNKIVELLEEFNKK
jgi:transcriptional regulator with XRE-family HTH domain